MIHYGKNLTLTKGEKIIILLGTIAMASITVIFIFFVIDILKHL